jgi:septum site-determining protein MinC
MNRNPAVRIKGIREGLLVTVEAEPGLDLVRQLDYELAQKKGFLRGSRVALAVGEQILDRPHLSAVQDLLARHGMALWAVLSDTSETKDAARDLGLATRLPGSQTDLDGKAVEAPFVRPAEPTPAPAVSESSGSQGGILLKETLRSGRSISHEGHVIIIGDVNPGAQIVAGGDVVVWGKLRGLVHAGAMGDQSAVICALELIPTQLRIADQIAIAPDRRRQPIPEMASIRGGQIVAEAWKIKD